MEFLKPKDGIIKLVGNQCNATAAFWCVKHTVGEMQVAPQIAGDECFNPHKSQSK